MKNIKKILLFALVISMVFAMSACGKEPAAKEKLTMATEATFPPYEFYEGDKIVGIDAEIAEAVCNKMGYDLEIVDIAFDSIIPAVQSGKYSFGMAGITVSEDRKEKVDFSDSYATGVQVVIVKDGGKVSCLDDLFADGAYNLVAVQAGTTGEIYASGDIADAGLGEVQSYQKNTDAVLALLNGKCDCIILDNEPAKALIKDHPELHILDTEYSVEDYAVCFAKGNTELIGKFNEALAALIKDGTVQQIINKYIK